MCPFFPVLELTAQILCCPICLLCRNEQPYRTLPLNTLCIYSCAGIQIEEPYSVLPLHRYTMGIGKAVELTLANWHDCACMAEGVAGVAAASVAAAAAAAAGMDGWGDTEGLGQGLGSQPLQPQERPPAVTTVREQQPVLQPPDQ